MNKKAFTLIELIAVIIILTLVLSIVVPTITNASETIKKDSFLAAAKVMIASARSKTAEDKSIKLPAADYDGTIITLDYMRLNNVAKDADGGNYNRDNSYVLIIKIDNQLYYYVTLQGVKRKINLIKEEVLDSTHVITNTVVIMPKGVGQTYTANELNETGSFTVTIRQIY